MPPPAFIPLPDNRRLAVGAMPQRAAEFLAEVRLRRSVRSFAPLPVPREVIDLCLRAAALAPSGANQQPWTFVAVSDPGTKRQIREAAEAEERRFYEERAPQRWLEALAPLGTGPEKPYLDVAPWVIAVFVQMHGGGATGERLPHYYPLESVGIATGFLLLALHHAGLATLTHTPSPMGFLNRILGRPPNEKPFLLVITGFPAADATAPPLARRPTDQVILWRESRAS